MRVAIEPKSIEVLKNGLRIIINIKEHNYIEISSKVIDEETNDIYAESFSVFQSNLSFKRGYTKDFLLGKEYIFKDALKHTAYDYYSWKFIEILDNLYYEKYNKFDEIHTNTKTNTITFVVDYFGVNVRIIINYNSEREFARTLKKIKKMVS